CLADGRADTLCWAAKSQAVTKPEQLGGFGIAKGRAGEMSQAAAPAGDLPTLGGPPARFADATRAREAALGFDLRQLPAEYYANPYRTYHALREPSPVHRMPDGGYFLSRYADCLAVYKDTAAYSSDKKQEYGPKYGPGMLYEHHTTSLIFNDPPLHTRVRRIMPGPLTPPA